MTARAPAPPRPAGLPPGCVWKGNADLIPLLKPLADLVPDAENAKIHPEHNLAGIRESLGLLSQYKPLTGWRPAPGSKIVVMAGNGTFESIRALGWTHAAVTVYEGKPHAARTLALIDNKTAESSTWNEELAARQMEEVTTAWNAETVAPAAEVAAPVVERAPEESHALSAAGSTPPAKATPAPTRPPAGPPTFARALAIKIAEIAPGPHRVGLIESALRRVFEKSAKAIERLDDPDREPALADAEEALTEAARVIRALPDEVVE